VDGAPIPLLYVSPTQINAQLPERFSSIQVWQVGRGSNAVVMPH
jgi:uncharacterized protein (TIGR03437 family)